MKKFSKELLTGAPADGYWKNLLWKMNFAQTHIPYSTMQDIIAYLSDPKNIREDFNDIEESRPKSRFLIGYFYSSFIQSFGLDLFLTFNNTLFMYEKENN